MLVGGQSLLDWGRRTAAMIMAVGSGRWYRIVQRHPAQVDQPHSARARPPAGPAAPPTTSLGASSPDQVPPQQRLASPRSHRPTPAPAVAAVVRAWAHAQGLLVADRGPVPGWVMDQYLAQEGRPASAGPSRPRR